MSAVTLVCNLYICCDTATLIKLCCIVNMNKYHCHFVFKIGSCNGSLSLPQYFCTRPEYLVCQVGFLHALCQSVVVLGSMCTCEPAG